MPLDPQIEQELFDQFQAEDNINQPNPNQEAANDVVNPNLVFDQGEVANWADQAWVQLPVGPPAAAPRQRAVRQPFVVNNPGQRFNNIATNYVGVIENEPANNLQMFTMKDYSNVKPLNLDNILGTPKNRVSKVGVELEGAWTKLPEGIIDLEHDGSVFKDPKSGRQVPPGPDYRLGEIPIAPSLPGRIPMLMKRYYPAKINETCGMHVHMSFIRFNGNPDLRLYSWLMVPEYQETMIKYLSKWAEEEGFPKTHTIWGRLRGESTFCQKKFWPDLQVSVQKKDHDQNRPGHRYTIVNYSGRQGKQHTIEIRVLPMMETPEQAARAVRKVVDITNGCLYLLGKKESKTLSSKLILDEKSFHDEFYEEEVFLPGKKKT